MSLKCQLLHLHLQALLSSSFSKFSSLGSTDRLSSFRPNWFFTLAVFRRKDLLLASPTSAPLKLLRMLLFELGPTTEHITILGRMGCDCAVWLKCPVLRENHLVNDRPPAVEENFQQKDSGQTEELLIHQEQNLCGVSPQSPCLQPPTI